MHETDSCAARRARVAAALLAMALTACAHADPCAGSSCAGSQVCGLAGACGPAPGPEEVRFVEVRELFAHAEGDVPDRLVLGAGAEPVHLVFGPLPRGRIVSALLRVAPHATAPRNAEVVAEVRRGRREVAVRYAIGRDAPLFVDVSELLRGADAGERVALAVDVRGGDGVRFEASSPASPDPARRPTLTLVFR